GVVIGRFLVVRRFLVHAGFRAERRCRRSGGLLDGRRRGALRVRLVAGGRGDRDPVEAAEGVGQRKVVEERAHEGSRIGRGPDSAQAAGSRGDGPSVGRSRRGGGAVPGRRKAGAPATAPRGTAQTSVATKTFTTIAAGTPNHTGDGVSGPFFCAT